jgi:hypothetical protein
MTISAPVELAVVVQVDQADFRRSAMGVTEWRSRRLYPQRRLAMAGRSDHTYARSKACPIHSPMSASQEDACLKRMTPSPDATDATIRAFAGIPVLSRAAAVEGGSITNPVISR